MVAKAAPSFLPVLGFRWRSSFEGGELQALPEMIKWGAKQEISSLLSFSKA